MKKHSMLLIMLFLLIPKIAWADVAVSASYSNILLLPLIVIAESVLFWVLINKVLRCPFGVWKSFLVVIPANIITSVTGTFIEIFSYGLYQDMGVGFFLVSFFLSFTIEWAVYLAFFRKSGISRLKLLQLSLYVNIASYILLFIFLML